jgi:excisionase family DNA binding protein
MVQGYYTLEEAARILGMGSEELSQMAQKREVRAFADRGTWRFRTQDIEELARRRGLGSNPDLPLGEAGQPKPHDSPAPKKKDPSGSDEGVFTFALGDSGDQVEIGQEIISESPSSARASKSGSKSGPKSPPPKPGSDSDVRLVAEGSGVGHQITPDSGVALSPDDSGTKSDSGKKKKPDSGVRLAPDSDSDVKIVPDSAEAPAAKGGAPKSGTDSDIRLEGSGARGRQAKEDSYLTEEIDLDAELRAAEEAARAKKPPSGAKHPPVPGAPGRDTPVRGQSAGDSSSDFDLGIDSGSSIEIDSGDLKSKAEEVQLGEAPPRAAGAASDSGINLQRPADSGISLEQGGDSSEEIEFELSLDAESTPKPAKASPNVDSSSEFELTLEDSARLAPLEEESKAAAKGEDKDIFETDFEVPALEDESGSQVAALEDSDTDLESSDFDLALGEEDAAATEESGSQVVALEDEEEADEGAATVARPRKGGAAVEEEEAGEDLLQEEELEEEEEVVLGRRPAVAAAPADWGLFAPITLCVSMIILFVVGLMSWELLNSMWGYRQPNKASAMVIKSVGSLLGVDSKDLEK